MHGDQSALVKSAQKICQNRLTQLCIAVVNCLGNSSSHQKVTIFSDSKSCLSSLNWPGSGKNTHFLALFWLVERTLGIGWK